MNTINPNIAQMRQLKDNWFKDLKIGDEVIINERKGLDSHYLFYFTDDMTKYTGRIFRIRTIKKGEAPFFKSPYHNGDGNAYRLENSACVYSSSIFSPMDDRFYITN